MKKTFLLSLITLVYLSATASKVDTLHIQSAAMGKKIPTVVITPDRKNNKTSKYPVVYMLHGYSGNYASFVNSFPVIKKYADDYQCIIVCPDGGYSSWYFNSPFDKSYQYETFVAKELVQYIDARYPTVPFSTKRGITGLSMGGHGAFYLAIKHPDIFGAAASMSGGVDFRPFPENWDIAKRIGEKSALPENWETNVVINMVDKLPNKKIKLWFDCGVDDFFIEGNRALHKKLTDLKIEHEYMEGPGEHNNAYWNRSVSFHMLFFHLFFAQKQE